MSGTTETHRKLVNMIVRGKLEESDDTHGFQLHQVSLLADETKTNVERFQQYGFTGNPMPGSEVLVVFPGGSRDHGIIIGIDNRASRLPGMAPGEVSIYSDEGDAISLRRGNGVEVVTKTFYVKADGAVIIECGGPVTIKATTVEIDAALVTIKGDLHVTGQVVANSAGAAVGLTTHGHPALNQKPNAPS